MRWVEIGFETLRNEETIEAFKGNPLFFKSLSMNELRPPLAMYSFFLGVVVPALYIMIVLACDYVIPNGLITPFFVTLGLLIMAL